MSLGQSLKNYASTRRVYGANRSSRLAFWFALVLIPFGVWGFWLHNLGNSALPQWLRIVLAVAAPLIWFVNSILLQEPAASSVADDYSHVIADLENIEKQLDRLQVFLKKERQKVGESEATLRRLADEKDQLEPVVLTQRETVNAILAAHSKTTTSVKWKERAFGFFSGVFASLVAAVVFEYLRN
jgi:hypothetical protein